MSGADEQRKQDIEISAGTNSLGKALDFGRQLATKLNYQYSLSAQIEAGSNKAKSISKDKEIDTTLVLPALDHILNTGRKKGNCCFTS